MSKSLKYQVVKLAKENPSLRRHLLPLVTGKTANDDGLRLALTKLAYANPNLRSAILPLVKTSGNDKFKMMNENGRVVWVSKKTLQGPKGKNYKPIKEEPKKEEKSRSKDEIKEDLDDAKEYLQEANDEYDEAQQDFTDWVSALENAISEAGFSIDPLDAQDPEEVMAEIEEWVEREDWDDSAVADEKESAIDDALKEVKEHLKAYERAGNSLEKAQKEHDKYEEELKQSESKKEKKQQGGGKTKVKMNEPQSKEMAKAIKDTVEKIKGSLSKKDKRLLISLQPQILEQSMTPAEMLEELDSEIANDKNKDRPEIIKALKKIKNVIKPQGGGGKKKEKPAEETSDNSSAQPQSLADKKKAIKDSIDKNPKLSQKEKDAQKKALEKMNEGDIDKKLKAMGDDEEEVKTSSLKYELVKLAHQKPELRKHILPLLK